MAVLWELTVTIHFYSNSDTCKCLSFLCWNCCACTSGVNNYYSLLFKFFSTLGVDNYSLLLNSDTCTCLSFAGIFVAVLLGVDNYSLLNSDTCNCLSFVGIFVAVLWELTIIFHLY